MAAYVTQLVGASDSEIIAGGLNHKGDFCAGLAREANFFTWGPAGTPSQMTEEARRVLVNTIVYMKQFDGAEQTVWRDVKNRARLANLLTLKPNIFALNAKFNFSPDMIKAFGNDAAKYRELFEPNLGYLHVPHGREWYAIDEEAKSIG